MISRTCQWCQEHFLARAIDVKKAKGGGKFCSLSCKTYPVLGSLRLSPPRE